MRPGAIRESAARALVTRWNDRFPVGTCVILTDDVGVEHRTVTRSEAWLLGCGQPLVMVEGRAGGYSLHRVRAAGPED